MAYTYKTIELPSSKYSLKCPNKMEAKYIVIHNTDNNAPAINEIKYMQSNNNSTSFHIAVDESEAIQGLPLDRNAWHAGDGSGTNSGNRNGIAIEICRSTSDSETFKKAQDNAILLVASMLKERNWGIDKVKKHQDFSGKNCPKRTLSDYGWQWFLDRVQEALNGEKVGEKTMRTFELLQEMNMRTAPNGNIVCVVPRGTRLSGSEFATTNGTTWVYSTYNGKSGYVAVLPEIKGYAKEVADEKEYICYVDVANENGIVGWCKDTKTNTPYELHLYVNGNKGTVGYPGIMANKYREDVKKAGFGNGYSGFNWSHDLYADCGEGTFNATLYVIDGNNPAVWQGKIKVNKNTTETEKGGSDALKSEITQLKHELEQLQSENAHYKDIIGMIKEILR